jgi:hypothetical protein
MADWASLGLAFVTGGLALGGVWMGKTLERSTTNETWHRSQRRDAYAQHLANSHEAWRALNEHYMDTYVKEFAEGEERQTSTREAWYPLVALSSSASLVQMMGPQEIGDLAEAVSDLGGALMKWLAEPTLVAPFFHEHGEALNEAAPAKAYSEATDAYLRAASAELA